MSEPTLFDELGGEPALRRIIDRFVDRMFDDVMIGFFFARASRQRIKEKEYEHAAEHLGGGVIYTGRPIQEAHAKHPIMGGQFMRRLKLLDDTLREHGAPERVRQHWLAHAESLRPLVTRDSGGRCDPAAALDKTSRAQAPPKDET